MKDKIIQQLENLTDSNLAELSHFIDFLKFKTKFPDLYEKETLADHFRRFRIYNWKELANAIRESGIPIGPVGGYMDSYAVINWISSTFTIEYKKAEEVLNILIRQKLLNESYHGNVN